MAESTKSASRKSPSHQSINQSISHRKPPSLYGFDWRLCLMLTQCVHAYLFDNSMTAESPDLSIDWSIIAVMLASKCAITAQECRMIWKTIAYDTDENGRACMKRIRGDEDDSDIDAELPSLSANQSINQSVKTPPLKMLRMDSYNSCVNWNSAADLTLVKVVSDWVARKRHASSIPPYHQAINQSTNQSTNQSASEFAIRMLPSLVDEWAAVSSMFQVFCGVKKSPSFLSSRFSLIARTAFSCDQSINQINQDPALTVGIRTLTLTILGVEDSELIEQAIHGVTMNYRPEVAQRRRRQKTRQRDIHGAKKANISQSAGQSISQSAEPASNSQSTNQSSAINQPDISQSSDDQTTYICSNTDSDQSINQASSTHPPDNDLSTNQSVNQSSDIPTSNDSSNQPINQSINQSTSLLTDNLDVLNQSSMELANGHTDS